MRNSLSPPTRACLPVAIDDLALKALRVSESRYRRLFETARDGILLLNADTAQIEDVNPYLMELLGYSHAEFLGKKLWEVGAFADILESKEMFAKLQITGYVRYADLPLRTRAGVQVAVEFVSNSYDCEGTKVIQCNIRNISGRKRDEEQLRIAAVAFESQESMMITDANGLILRVNHAFTETTGYTADEVVGQSPKMLRSSRHNEDFYRAMWEAVHGTGGWQGEIWDRHKDGRVRPKWLNISAVKDAEGAVTHYISAHHDISERKAAEKKINELAFFDQLTGLSNRTRLLDCLMQTMTASLRSGNFGALLFIDLDNFKTLNDSLGHDVGDLLLKQVAQILMQCVREGDTVARLGGDEFVVVLAGLSTHEGEAAIATEVAGEKILAALGQLFQLGLASYRSTASIGATLFRGQQTAIEVLMKQSDLAMYKAKDAGRNTLRFYDPVMGAVVTKRVTLESDLRVAFQDGQFLLHYQPQVVDAGRITGTEVLVRWEHPQRGMVSPAEFISVAEETGLILPLGYWVLEAACTQLAVWSTRPEMAHLTVAVNVSARQFRHENFVDQVLEILDRTGANPQRLKLELTESMLVSNMEEIIGKMSALKAKGVGFALDDFGTGYSSLSYLKRLPLDQLKIDRSFVCDALTNPNDCAISKTIIALAHSLGLGVIAEGVETQAQKDFLSDAGCHAYQGHFFSHPLPLEDFEAMAHRELIPAVCA